MKKRKTSPTRLLPKVFHLRRKGEWVEIAFLLKATSLGMVACRPFGDNQPFDFLVCTPSGAVLSIQVKSAWCMQRQGAYSVPCDPKHFSTSVDFLVAYVLRADAWYVVPSRVLRKAVGATFFPHRRNSRGKFERYREAWHLLLHPRKLRQLRGLEIRACADPEHPAP